MTQPIESELWERVQRLFTEAMALPEGERAAYLRREAADAPRVRAEVESLVLHASTRAGRRIDDIVASAASRADTQGGSAVGSRLGPYRLEREIGRGGMGVVYLGVREDDDFEQRVAIKLLPGALYSEELAWRFGNERRILASLEHPCIARFLDGGTTPEGIPFAVMEFVDGIPVDAHCEEVALDLDARLDLFVRICDAVRYAHGQLVVHRDLKPANILVDGRGTPRLLDFGIAKLLDPDDLGVTGTRIMTPRFASPEQVSGAPAGTATDVYALGGLLYLLLTGRPPHADASSRSELVRRILETDPIPPSAVKSEGSLSGDLDTIVLKAMRRDPTERYASVDRMMQDVAAFRGSHPISARPPTLAYRTRKFVRRNRAAVLAAVIGASGVLGGAGAATAGMLRARQAEAAALEDARVAAEVSDFLVGVFAEPDPANALGEELTARALLDRGVERIERELEGQSVLQARLKKVMADSYGALDDFDRSVQLYREALQLAESAELRASIYGSLIGALRYTDRFDEASATIDELMAMVEPVVDTADAGGMRRTPELSDGLVTALQERGMVLVELGDTAGLASLRRAARLRERFGGPDAESVGRTFMDLAIGHNMLGDHEEAVPLYRRALDIYASGLDPKHPAILDATANLAATYAALERFDSATAIFERVLPLQREVWGPRNAATVQTMFNLGSMLSDLGEDEAAEPYLREALEMRRELFGDDHLQITAPLNNLAELHRRRGDFASAEELWTRATEIRRLRLGPDHPATVATLLGIANTRRLRENWVGSAQTYEEAIGYLRRQGPVAPEILLDYALVLRSLGRVGEAEALEEESRMVGDEPGD